MTTTANKQKVRITTSSTGLVIGSEDNDTISRVYDTLAPLAPLHAESKTLPKDGVFKDGESLESVVGASFLVAKKSFANRSYVAIKTNGLSGFISDNIDESRFTAIKCAVAAILEANGFEIELVDPETRTPFAEGRRKSGKPAMAYIMVENDCITVGCRDVFEFSSFGLLSPSHSIDVDDVLNDFRAALKGAANVLGPNEPEPERPKHGGYTLGVTVSGAAVYGVVETKLSYTFDQIKVAAKAIKEALEARKYNTTCERAQRIVEPIDL